MELIKHTNSIFEYKKIVDQDTCNNIANTILRECETDIQIKDYIEKGAHRTAIRNNTSLNITRYGNYNQNLKKIDTLVNEIFAECHSRYVNDNASFFYLKNSDYINNLFSEYFFRSYNQNDYYDWHIDTSQNVHHVFSYILYLNEDFDGGETLFLNEKLKITPTKGSMLCFPCNITMLHKSTKIKSGQKNIIWSCFAKETKFIR